MKTTVSENGTILLPEAVRAAANIHAGDVLEVESRASGTILLSHAAKIEGAKKLFGVEPFPPGTLAGIYQVEDPLWKEAEAAAIRAQSPPRFDE